MNFKVKKQTKTNWSAYHREYLGAKTAHGLDIDFIGILNESPYSIDYIKLLRKTLDQEGFTNTQIVAADGWSDICSDMAQDPELSAAVHVIGLHYPSDYSDLTEKCTTGLFVFVFVLFSSLNHILSNHQNYYITMIWRRIYIIYMLYTVRWANRPAYLGV